MSFNIPPTILLMLATLFWSGNLLVGRAMVDGISPASTAFWRFFPALIILVPFVFPDFWRFRHLVFKHIGYLVLLSVTGIAGFQWLVYQSLSMTTAVNASLFLSLTPLFIVIIAFVMGEERPGWRQVSGIMVSLTGVLVLISQGRFDIFKNLAFNSGDLLMMSAIPLWALYSVLLKRRPLALPPKVLLFATILITVIVLLPFYIRDNAAGRGVPLDWNSFAVFGYLSLFASVLAYQFWNSGVRRIGAVRSGPFMHLVPVFSMILAILLLGEKLYFFHYIGVPLIAVGIWLNTRK